MLCHFAKDTSAKNLHESPPPPTYTHTLWCSEPQAETFEASQGGHTCLEGPGELPFTAAAPVLMVLMALASDSTSHQRPQPNGRVQLILRLLNLIRSFICACQHGQGYIPKPQSDEGLGPLEDCPRGSFG